MRLSTAHTGRSYTQTAFQNFMETYDLCLLTVKVQCPECGHIWGISVDDFQYSTDIPEKKFKCGQCGHYHAEGDELNELRLDNGSGHTNYEAEREHIRRKNGYLTMANVA